jgi:glycine/D-amino acid oxidase-like deaminating enzyme
LIPHAGKSFWIGDAGHYEPEPSLRSEKRCDVVVIGAGIAGLSTAWNLRRADASIRVIVLEAEIVGFGASGRAAGFVMPQIGLDEASVLKKYGDARAKESFRYGRHAVEYTKDIIKTHELDSEYRQPGLMRIAFSDRWRDKLAKTLEFYQSLPGNTATWIEGPAVQKEFAGNTDFKAAIFEGDVGVIHPCKHVRALKKLAMSTGVEVFENTPAVELHQTTNGVTARTPFGTVSADRMVIATNGWTNSLQGGVGKLLKRDQAPYMARASVTERLTPEQWESIGWLRRGPIESNASAFHWAVPTSDGRIVFNSTLNGAISRHGEYEPMASADGADFSEEQIRRIFPQLRNVRRFQTWGGPVSITRDLVPHIGYLAGDRVMYINGCWGHGLSISHLHGRTVAEILRGEKSEFSDFWMLKKKKQPWPIPPLDYVGKVLVWQQRKTRAMKDSVGTIFE